MNRCGVCEAVIDVLDLCEECAVPAPGRTVLTLRGQCQRGHRMTQTVPTARWRCRECEIIRDAAARERRKWGLSHAV